MRIELLKRAIFVVIVAIAALGIYANNSSLVKSIVALELRDNNNILNFERYILVLNYGNWCGVRNTSSLLTKPIDEVDAICKAHDLCIGNNDHKCICDAIFLKDMSSATASSETGERYKRAAIEIIERKPCYCRETSKIGIGGKCDF